VTKADGAIISAAYICDVKIVSAYRGRIVLGRLAMRARDEIIASGYHAAYSIVMSGSPPADQHTGRLGIPNFEKIGELAILRFDTHVAFKWPRISPRKKLGSSHRINGADAASCSEINPIPLAFNTAYGRIVDTRLGKQLWQSNGHELISAHLIDLQFDSIDDLVTLVKAAIIKAAECGFPGLFLALPETSEFPSILSKNFPDVGITLAGAAIYGTGMPTGDWMVNTSEI
jgi:hypothetical protein